MSILLLGFKPDRLSHEQLARVRQAAPGMQLLVSRDRQEIEAVLDDIEIAAGSVPRELLSRARNLRWLQQWSAGADWLLKQPDALAPEVVLTNVSGIHRLPIAEHIFALMLAFARRLPQAVRAQERREWLDQMSSVFELAGKTMLLVGVGEIGRRTAELAHAFAMRVVGVRRDPSRAVPDIETMVGPERLTEYLPDADFVVLTVPLTHETRKMIGATQLSAMKRTAYLINIGRGAVLDEAALVMALQKDRIAGAGLDVFETEPLPKDSPLWGMENVIITSHYSGGTPDYDRRALAIFLDNLERYHRAEPLRNVVDRELGY